MQKKKGRSIYLWVILKCSSSLVRTLSILLKEKLRKIHPKKILIHYIVAILLTQTIIHRNNGHTYLQMGKWFNCLMGKTFYSNKYYQQLFAFHLEREQNNMPQRSYLYDITKYIILFKKNLKEKGAYSTLFEVRAALTSEHSQNNTFLLIHHNV